jgi:diguanylate cyclase (GGDEF)-like protein
MLDVFAHLATHVAIMWAAAAVFALILCFARDWRVPWQWAAGFAAMPALAVVATYAERFDSDVLRVTALVSGVVGPALLIDGLRRFVGVPPRRWVWVAWAAGMSVAAVGVMSLTDNFDTRFWVYRVFAIFAISCLVLLVMRLPREEHPVSRVVVVALAAIVFAAMLFRLVAGLAGYFKPALGDGAAYLPALVIGDVVGVFLAVSLIVAIAERMAARLRHVAEHDALTGLANRRLFERELEAELARFHRYGRPVAVVTFDVDHFKKINDTHGHDVGDLALKRVADAARAVLRPTDVIARLGGDEFAVVLPETEAEAAAQAAQRVLAQVRDVVLLVRGGAVAMTGSFGVAGVTRRDTAESLLKRADEALYDVKRAGRNGVAIRLPRDPGAPEASLRLPPVAKRA